MPKVQRICNYQMVREIASAAVARGICRAAGWHNRYGAMGAAELNRVRHAASASRHVLFAA